jgi:hypothetical protein
LSFFYHKLDNILELHFLPPFSVFLLIKTTHSPQMNLDLKLKTLSFAQIVPFLFSIYHHNHFPFLPGFDLSTLQQCFAIFSSLRKRWEAVLILQQTIYLKGKQAFKPTFETPFL